MLRVPWTRSSGQLLVTFSVISITLILVTNYSNGLYSLGQQLREYASQRNAANALLSPVVFAMVMIGETSAREGVIAIKTALMHVSRPTEFHIICSSDAIPIIRPKFKLFSRPAYDVKVVLYPIQESYIQQRAERSRVSLEHQTYGYRGLVKIWMHELLVDVEKAIFFDNNMMFLVDPYLLWRQFDDFIGEQMIHLPIEGPYSGATMICSCVMLLNFAEMRARTFMDSTLFTQEMNSLSMGNNITWDKYGIDSLGPDSGDRSLYWAIWRRFPDRFAHLSEAWDVTSCENFWEVRLDAGDENTSEFQQGQLSLKGKPRFSAIPEAYTQIFPGIVHYNCRGSPPAWENTELAESPSWGPYVTIAKQYKWVWLNRGKGKSTVNFSVKDNITFYDEIIGQKPQHTSTIV